MKRNHNEDYFSIFEDATLALLDAVPALRGDPDLNAINDRHGHRGGDQVLVEVSERLQHRLRSTDADDRKLGRVLLPEVGRGERRVDVPVREGAIRDARLGLGCRVGTKHWIEWFVLDLDQFECVLGQVAVAQAGDEHALRIDGQRLCGAPPRLRLLLSVIQADCDRVMHVVHLRDEIGDGELELVCPQTGRFVLRHQPQNAYLELNGECFLE